MPTDYVTGTLILEVSRLVEGDSVEEITEQAPSWSTLEWDVQNAELDDFEVIEDEEDGSDISASP